LFRARVPTVILVDAWLELDTELSSVSLEEETPILDPALSKNDAKVRLALLKRVCMLERAVEMLPSDPDAVDPADKQLLESDLLAILNVEASEAPLFCDRAVDNYLKEWI
jgi:hypothetical protein